jgi:prenyl protein peptidase
MWLLFTPTTSLLLASLTAASFVLVLYAWSNVRVDRDDPRIIRQRILATGALCVAMPPLLWLLQWSPPSEAAAAELGPGPPVWEWLGLPASMSPRALWTYTTVGGAPLLLTASLFLGPVVVQLLEAAAHASAMQTGVKGAASFAWHRFSSHWSPTHRWQSLRNLVAAPLCEEVVFRGAVLAILVSGGFGFRECVLLSPMLFGLAHLHHLLMHVHARGASLRQAAVMVTFQLAYTSLFGMYAAALLLRTNHLLGAVLAHSWCNLLGVPDLSFLARKYHPLYPKRVQILLVYLAGIVVFALALRPLTDDSSWLYTTSADAESHDGTGYKPLHTGSWLLHYQRMRQQGDMDKFLNS